MKTKKIQIKNRFTSKVIFESTTAVTIKQAVEEAVKSKANLCKANLWKADLLKANLSKANLSKADLSEANLSEANLSEADLSEANLLKANLLFCRMDKQVFKQITKEWFEWNVEK